jgi:hypothetical protein
VWIAKFMLKHPKTDPGRKYVSTLTFNKQWGSSMELLRSLAVGGQSVPTEAQLNELPKGSFCPDKFTPKWITRLTRVPVQSVTLTEKQATEYAKEMYRRHKPNWKLVGSDKQGNSWTFRFRLKNPKTESGKNYIAGLTVSSDWESSRELLQSLAVGTLGIPSSVK